MEIFSEFWPKSKFLKNKNRDNFRQFVTKKSIFSKKNSKIKTLENLSNIDISKILTKVEIF